jgi:hypothetical protein
MNPTPRAESSRAYSASNCRRRSASQVRSASGNGSPRFQCATKMGERHVLVERDRRLRQVVQSTKQRAQSAGAGRCSIVLRVVLPEGHDRGVDRDGLVDVDWFDRGKALH